MSGASLPQRKERAPQYRVTCRYRHVLMSGPRSSTRVRSLVASFAAGVPLSNVSNGN